MPSLQMNRVFSRHAIEKKCAFLASARICATYAALRRFCRQPPIVSGAAAHTPPSDAERDSFAVASRRRTPERSREQVIPAAIPAGTAAPFSFFSYASYGRHDFFAPRRYNRPSRHDVFAAAATIYFSF